MATGTGHWPGGTCRALEDKCTAITTYFSHQTKPYIKILFLKPHLNHPRQRWVTQARDVIKLKFSAQLAKECNFYFAKQFIDLSKRGLHINCAMLLTWTKWLL